MRDPRFYGTGTEDWRTGDGGRWWLRNNAFGEPNGDYAARAWLGLTAGGYWQSLKDWPHIQKRSSSSPVSAGMTYEQIDKKMKEIYG